jgi:hypothetical protein
MRRVLWMSLVLGTLAAAGCWELRPYGESNKPPAQNRGSALPLRPAPIVTPEQVNQENAHQKAEALREEIEQAQRDLPAATVSEGSAAGRPSR